MILHFYKRSQAPQHYLAMNEKYMYNYAAKNFKQK